MASANFAELGKGIPILLQIEDGAINQFPQAEIRDNDDNLLITLNLAHVANGLYKYTYTMPNETFIFVTYIVYSDSYGGTESTVYGRDVDTFCLIVPSEYMSTGFAQAGEYDATFSGIQTDLNKLEGHMFRSLGLTQENQYIDNTIYSHGNLTNARLRIYSVSGSVGTDNDVIATYTITSTYSNLKMTTYSMVKI